MFVHGMSCGTWSQCDIVWKSMMTCNLVCRKSGCNDRSPVVYIFYRLVGIKLMVFHIYNHTRFGCCGVRKQSNFFC